MINLASAVMRMHEAAAAPCGPARMVMRTDTARWLAKSTVPAFMRAVDLKCAVVLQDVAEGAIASIVRGSEGSIAAYPISHFVPKGLVVASSDFESIAPADMSW